MSKRTIAYLALFGNVFIWGAAVPLSKPALDIINPYQLLFFRYLIAFIVTLPLIARLFFKRTLTTKLILTITAIESLNFFSLLTLYQGVEITSALQASMLLNTRPIIITILGILMLHEVEELHEWIGLILSIAGTAILVLYPIWDQGIDGDFSITGGLLILCTNLITAAYIYLMKTHYQQLSKTDVQSISTVVILFFFALLMLLSPAPIPISDLASPSVLLAILFLGIFATPIAFILRNVGYTSIEASEATLFSYLRPLVYIPLSVIWLGETIHPSQSIGLIITIIGVAIAEFRPKNGLITRIHRVFKGMTHFH